MTDATNIDTKDIDTNDADNAENKEKGPKPSHSRRWVFHDYWKEIFASCLAAGGYVAGALVGSTEIAVATAVIVFFYLVAFTSRNTVWSFALLTAGLAAALAFSETAVWRMGLSVLTFLIPALYICWHRRYPKRLGKLLRDFSEEATKLGSLEEIAVAATRLLDHNGFYKNAAVLLGDKNAEELVIVGCSSQYEQGMRIRRGNGVCWRAFDTGRPVSLFDAASNLHFLPSHARMKAALAVPLAVGGKKFGVLEVETTKNRRFSRLDKETAILFATMVSFAFSEFAVRQPQNSIIKQHRENVKNGIHCAAGDDVA